MFSMKHTNSKNPNITYESTEESNTHSIFPLIKHSETDVILELMGMFLGHVKDESIHKTELLKTLCYRMTANQQLVESSLASDADITSKSNKP